MAGTAVQVFGFCLGLLGFVGTVVATLLPHWRCTYVGSNVVTATAYLRGLWMTCVWHSAGVYQCEPHRSLLALPHDLQAARALMVLSCVTSVLASPLAVMGMKCTSFADSSVLKPPLALSGGVGFLCAGLLCLVTVSWTTKEVMMDLYEPFPLSGRGAEIGLAVYLGYAAGCLSLMAGLMLVWSSRSLTPLQSHPPSPVRCPCKPREGPRGNKAPSLCSLSSSSYRLYDYV